MANPPTDREDIAQRGTISLNDKSIKLRRNNAVNAGTTPGELSSSDIVAPRFAGGSTTPLISLVSHRSSVSGRKTSTSIKAVIANKAVTILGSKYGNFWKTGLPFRAMILHAVFFLLLAVVTAAVAGVGFCLDPLSAVATEKALEVGMAS
jgi:hypothetical protein